jgi:hypothetical protein
MKELKYYLPIPLCAGLASFFCYFPITDADIFWHLAAGREMIAHKHFLFTDPFAFTLASPQWTDLHWLFQLCAYGLFKLGGMQALIWGKLLVVAITCSLLCMVFRSSRYIMISAVLSVTLFYEARYLVCERPVLVTMLCMASYVFLFEHVRQGGNKLLLWLCVPLQIVWTNSQGLYPIGIFIIGVYWLEKVFDFVKKREEKPVLFSGVLVLSAVSCLVNPYGLAGVTLPFTLFSRIAPIAQNIYSLNISENVPLFSLTGFEAGYRTAVIVAAVVACLSFVLNRKKIRVAHAFLFVGFSYLAYGAVRNVLLYFIIIIPIIGYNTVHAGLLDRLNAFPAAAQRTMRIAAAALALGLAVVLATGHYAVVALYPPHRVLSPFRFPEKITAYLKANPVPGEMFNDLRHGGYLIWQLYPPKKVFADTRLIIRTPRFFAEYLAICNDPGLFPFVAEKFNITQAILPSAIFPQYRKLIAWLYESPDWHLECTDGSTFLFVKNSASQRPAINISDPTAVHAIAGGICTEWKDAPFVRQEALGYFSDMLGYLGLKEQAQKVKKLNVTSGTRRTEHL